MPRVPHIPMIVRAIGALWSTGVFLHNSRSLTHSPSAMVALMRHLHMFFASGLGCFRTTGRSSCRGLPMGSLCIGSAGLATAATTCSILCTLYGGAQAADQPAPLPSPTHAHPNSVPSACFVQECALLLHVFPRPLLAQSTRANAASSGCYSTWFVLPPPPMSLRCAQH